jgi:hypothetical protein
MPATEPEPDGTCLAYAAQPGPTRSAAGSIEEEADGVEDAIGALESLDDAPAPDEQAVRARAAAAMRPTAARRAVVRIVLFSFEEWCGL